MGVFAGRRKVFLSYRRSDSRHATGRVYAALRSSVPSAWIFMDVDAILPGADFQQEIEGSIRESSVVVVVIGAEWLEGGDGRRRLDDPGDVVRIEIETALNLGVPIIPVLLDDVRMPAEHEIPESIRPLVRINAARIRHDSFGSDVRGLATLIKAGPQYRSASRGWAALVVVSGVCVAGFALIFFLAPHGFFGVNRRPGSPEARGAAPASSSASARQHGVSYRVDAAGARGAYGVVLNPGGYVTQEFVAATPAVSWISVIAACDPTLTKTCGPDGSSFGKLSLRLLDGGRTLAETRIQTANNVTTGGRLATPVIGLEPDHTYTIRVDNSLGIPTALYFAAKTNVHLKTEVEGAYNSYDNGVSSLDLAGVIQN